tara:strand:+ start:1846 stop:2445 length:600 start_codon:yes stop_codon:yes gene_type:complete
MFNKTERKEIHVLGNGDLAKEFISFSGFDETITKSYSISEIYKIDLKYIIDNKHKVYIAISKPSFRKEIFEYLVLNGLEPDTFIHPSVIIGKRTSIGLGCIIQPNTIISNDVIINKSVFINCNSNIGHDVVIGDYCSIMTNVNLGGHCIIDEGVFIGTAASLIPKVKINSNITIGLASVVIKNLMKKGSYFGNPAKLIN